MFIMARKRKLTRMPTWTGGMVLKTPAKRREMMMDPMYS
jgi:hypothetical protein